MSAQIPRLDALRFQAQAGSTVTAASQQLLTAEERAFIAQLPVVRVAVPLPPAQPYEVIGADGAVSGIHPDMLVSLANAFGIRVTPVLVPGWSAVLEAARRRDVDIVMTVGVTAERMNYLEFTLGATPLPGALFSRRNAPLVEASGARFVVEREYLAHDFIRREFPNASILVVDTTGEALGRLGAGDADYYLGSLLEATEWLNRQPVVGVEAVRLMSYGTGFYHFGVRKDWALLAGILNKGIQTLRTNPIGSLADRLAALPPELRPAPPLTLPESEAATLVRWPTWRIGAVRGLAHLNDVESGSVHSGIAAEYTEQIARRLGIAVQVVAFDNVAAMLEGLRQGTIDLIPFLTRTVQRAREFSFSQPYIEMPYVLVARSDAPMYWNLDSLGSKRLAMAREHPLREIVARRYPQIQVVDAADGNEAMNLVARRQADAAIEVKLFANLRVNGDNNGSLRVTTTVDELPAQFHLAAAPRRADLIPLVDRALGDISDVERQRMLRRWVAVDLKPAFPWQRYLPLLAVVVAALVLLGAATVWWTRRLQREVQVRRRSEELLNDIASTVPGIAFRYVLDENGRLRHHFFTPGAKAFLGIELNPEQSVLMSLAPYLDDEQRDGALAMERESLLTGKRFKLTAAYRPPGQPKRWLHAEAVQSRSHLNRVTWTGYVVDVTSERELQEQLERQAQERHLLLATASHELRVPANNVALAIQSIDPRALPADQAAALKIAKSSVQTLGQLLTDLLDTAQLDNGRIVLRPCSFDFPALLHELHETWQAAARDKGLGFEMHLEPSLPSVMMHDPVRIKQVLNNLLSNACKYTDAGKVELLVSRETNGLNFIVRDTGRGIPAHSRARVFEAYETSEDHRPSVPPQGSSGLGLVVSRRIAELMGGRLTLTSAPGQGSEFVFTMPLASPSAVATDRVEEGNIRVVICDDDPTSRLLTSAALERTGVEVFEASDGVEAIALWRQHDAQVLITDLDMPRMDGRELIRELRREERQTGRRRIFIIVCSGSALPEKNADADEDYDARLLKPVSLDLLVETLMGAKPLPGRVSSPVQFA